MLCPSSSSCHFHFAFLNSPHKSIVCTGEFGRRFNVIFQNKPPKLAFLSHTQLGASLACFPRPGALKVFVELGCTAGKRHSQVSGQYRNPPSLSQLPSQSEEKKQRTHRGTSGAASSRCTFTRRQCHRPSHFRKRVDTGIPPVPIPSSPLERSNLCQVICTKPHLQISKDTFVACASTQRALGPWLQLQCSQLHGISRFLYHRSRIFDLDAKATRTTTVPTGSRRARQGHNSTAAKNYALLQGTIEFRYPLVVPQGILADSN